MYIYHDLQKGWLEIHSKVGYKELTHQKINVFDYIRDFIYFRIVHRITRTFWLIKNRKKFIC